MLKFLRRLFLGTDPNEVIVEEQPVQVKTKVYKKPRPKIDNPALKVAGQNPGRKKKEVS
jgi:hypothetical protein